MVCVGTMIALGFQPAFLLLEFVLIVFGLVALVLEDLNGHGRDGGDDGGIDEPVEEALSPALSYLRRQHGR